MTYTLVNATLVFDSNRKCVSVIIPPEERKKLSLAGGNLDTVDIGENVAMKLTNE